MINQFIWGASLTVLAAACTYRLAEHPETQACEPVKPASRSVYVSPDVYQAVPRTRDIIAAWGMHRERKKKAGTVVVMQEGPASIANINPDGPTVIALGSNASTRVLSHELCHAAWRTTCHTSEGICARKVTQSSDWQPTQADLKLWDE